MAIVKVVNKNTHPYREKWDDKMIEIPAGGFVPMAKEDAVIFLGRMNAIVRDADGVPRAESFKRLTIEPMTAEDQKAVAAKGK